MDNVIFLNLFYLVVKEINKIERERERERERETGKVKTLTCLETLANLDTMKLDLQSRLDPFLRIQIQKHGISLIQNIYTGFDTEYELSDYTKFLNKLISTQIAVQSRILIKIPLYKPLDISFVHPLTSEISSFYKPEVSDWKSPLIPGSIESESEDKGIPLNEMKIINASFRVCLEKVRKELYSSLDKLTRV